MNKNKSIAKNAILNAIKSLLSILFPVITYPYVARVLHAENLGKVTFAQSIVSYFALLATLGVNAYAVREGSKFKGDNKKLNRFCNEIFMTNLFTTGVAYLLLIISVLFIPKLNEYATLILLLSATMFFTTIGVEWINVIFEDFVFITIRSIVAQIVNMILLFVFVRNENDYFIYAFLTVFSNIVVGVWNFIYCRRYVKFRFIRKVNCKKHLISLLVFFANNLAISLYCYSDTTMIGMMVGDACVGVYSVAVKAYTVIKTILAAVYSVCIPRLSNYYGNGEKEKFYELSNRLFSSLLLIVIPAIVGVIVLAKPIILFLGGVEYSDAIPTLRILSVALIFAIVGGIMSNCINIPTGKERITLSGTVIAAILNIALNIVLIPMFKQNGAAVTTVIAELVVVVVSMALNKDIWKNYKWKEIFVNVLHAMIGSLGIVISYWIVKKITQSIILICVFTIPIASISYVVILLLLKNQYAWKICKRQTMRLMLK